VEQAYTAVKNQFDSGTADAVFFGVLPIYMFAKQGDFQRYAKEFDAFDAPGELLGYYSGTNRGVGHMAMWKPKTGKDDQATRQAEIEWAYILTHEFTHAFIARYRTYAIIPHWLNEGVAEVVAHTQFTSGYNLYAFVRDREAKDNRVLKDILRDKGRLKGDDYPVVQTVVEYLQGIRRDAFLPFFNDIKDGMDPEKALKANYDMNYDQLEEAWRRQIKTVK
jgi:hypothetical protein